jgi:large subunit ribosomal protein L10
MIKEDKNQLLDALTEQLKASETVYLTDISDLDAEKTSKLRRLCFRRDVKLMVVKNTLLRLAMERSEKDFTGLYDVLKGHTSLMFSENSNTPARLIQEFRRESNRPVLKGAYVQEMVFVATTSWIRWSASSPRMKCWAISSVPCSPPCATCWEPCSRVVIYSAASSRPYRKRQHKARYHNHRFFN